MSNDSNETVDYEDAAFPTFDTLFSRMLKFSILVSCQIPSTLCSLAIFYYFIRLRELRAKLHNHVVICLLICNFLITSIELSITLVYLHYGQLIPSSYSLCLFWIFMNYLLFPSSVWIMAIASIQRYIFIFHRHLMNAHFKHYVPISLPPIFLFIWYFVLIFFYPCQQQFDYTQVWCLGACYVYQGIIGTIDWIISSFVPVLLTGIFNILLIVRVVYQKYTIQRAHTWRTTRKLVIQLLSISFLFLTIYLPLIIFGLIRLWIDPFFLFVFSIVYLAYVVYLVPLLVPFICLISLPEIVKQMKKLCCSSGRVEPMHPQQLKLTAFSRRNIQQTRGKID